MSETSKSLKRSSWMASALGFLSLSLSGELSPAWLVASWSAWSFSFISDRYPEFQTRLRRWETIAVMAMVGTLFLDFFIFRSTIFIAVTHFLLLFQIVKLAGEKTRKDCLQIFLFAFFQILAACTLSVDAWHGLILLMLIPTATATLFWNQIEREREQAGEEYGAGVQKNFRKMATFMCAAALPLNLALTLMVFLLFPRLTLNAHLSGFSGRHTGYTNQMNLAQKGNLEQDSSVVLWLSFPRKEDHDRWNGYLRGEILSQFDGREWNASKGGPARLITPDSNGAFFVRPPQAASPLIRQSITLADTSASTLFVVGRPLRILAPLPALQESEGGSLRWLASWRRPLRYEVISEPFSDVELRPVHRALPNLPLDRIRNLAQKIAGQGSPKQQAQAIQDYLQKNYRYSTNFGDRIPENPVDYFLFEYREGACGHFASAMALMLRLRKIPSRVVAGYLKGEWNEPAQAVVIRARNAHAWVEAYIPPEGWVSFDPTPVPAFGTNRGTNFLVRFQQYWDYLGLQWNRFVIQYDLYSQIKAFEMLKGTSGRLGITLASWWSRLQMELKHLHHGPESALESETRATARLPFKEICVFLFLAFVSFLGFIHKRRESGDSSIRFYSQFLDRMSRAGHPKAPEETGLEFARRVASSWPEQGAMAREVTERYYGLRFRRKGL